MSRHWALFDLRLRTPRLELRLPTEALIDDLIDVALDGVHDPDFMPFAVPWTDAPRDQLPLNTLQFFWQTLAEFRTDSWRLPFAVLHHGLAVGTQLLRADEFSVLREVSTGSWLGRAYQGQGIGTEMRAAVLHLAFDGLGAEYANSAAFTDNLASHRVSRKLGYVENGIERRRRRDGIVTDVRLRLDRAAWGVHRTIPVTVEGLEACLPALGVGAQPALEQS
jgi:RimJ/RimL family protein N-acetyltransferase